MPNRQHKNTVNKTQGNMVLPEPSYPATTKPRHPNETKTQEENLKSSLLKTIEPFLNDMNQSGKYIKKVETIKQEANEYKEI